LAICKRCDYSYYHKIHYLSARLADVRFTWAMKFAPNNMQSLTYLRSSQLPYLLSNVRHRPSAAGLAGVSRHLGTRWPVSLTPLPAAHAAHADCSSS